MANFEPSDDFIARIMNEVGKYERNADGRTAHVMPVAFSTPLFSLLSAGGILLGMLNLIRMALLLISPAPCM